MEEKKDLRPILLWLVSLALVLLLSSLSTQLWVGKPEKIEEPRALTIQEDMTLAELGEINQLPSPVLKSVFGLTTKENVYGDFIGILKRSFAPAETVTVYFVFPASG